jgi:hypothetical protein
MSLDLSSLSRKEKEELIKLLSQKALKQQENKLSTFQPNVGAQENFFKSQAKVRLLLGGNGLGKTTCLVMELLYTHLKCHPYRETLNTNHTWVIVPGLDKVEDYLREIKKWCPPSLLPQFDKMGSSSVRRLRWRNTNTTTFYSMDQDPAKLEGTNYDGLFGDEPMPRSLWIAAYRGLRNNPDYMVCLAMTPISEPWIYTDLYQPAVLGKDKRTEVFLGTTYENKFLSKEFVEDFKSRLSPDEYRVRILGEFAQLQGRVFKEFSQPTHVIPEIEWPREWPVWVGIDPHLRKPHTVVFVGVTPEDTFIVIDEIVFDGTVEELAGKILTLEEMKGYRVISRRIDNSGSTLDWSKDTAISHLLKAGVRVNPVRNREKNVADGIALIKALLRPSRSVKMDAAERDRASASTRSAIDLSPLPPRLQFFSSCPYTIQDMELYAWHDHRYPEKVGVNENPRKIHDDMIDPLKYVLMSGPIFHCATEPQSYLGSHQPYQNKTQKSEWSRLESLLKRKHD